MCAEPRSIAAYETVAMICKDQIASIAANDVEAPRDYGIAAHGHGPRGPGYARCAPPVTLQQKRLRRMNS
jgi:hypothetical protein